MIKWKEVDPTNFEKFIYHTLTKVGFYNRQWFGKGGGDKGRDVVAYSFEELPFHLGYKRKWIFQCKRWSKFPPSNIILNEIATATQHNPDFWVLVIPVNPSTNQIDYINNLNNSYPFKIILMPLSAIEEIINKYPELIHILTNGKLVKETAANV